MRAHFRRHNADRLEDPFFGVGQHCGLERAPVSVTIAVGDEDDSEVAFGVEGGSAAVGAVAPVERRAGADHQALRVEIILLVARHLLSVLVA